MSWRDNDFYRYFVQQPPITRTYLAGVIAVSLPPLLYLISPVWLINYWDYTIRGEIWRPLTAFLFGGSGISLLFGVFFVYQYSTQLETGKFGDSTATYAYYLLFSMVNIMVSYAPYSDRFLERSEHHITLISGWCLPCLATSSPGESVDRYAIPILRAFLLCMRVRNSKNPT